MHRKDSHYTYGISEQNEKFLPQTIIQRGETEAAAPMNRNSYAKLRHLPVHYNARKVVY
jgi:hypothetical protein